MKHPVSLKSSFLIIAAALTLGSTLVYPTSVGALVESASPNAPAGSASTYQFNNDHTDVNNRAHVALPARKLWTYKQPIGYVGGDSGNSTLTSYPLIINGRVFTEGFSTSAEYDNVLEGFNASTGTLLWPPVDIGRYGDETGTIAADSDNVYAADDVSVGSEAEIVISAYSQSTGHEIWSMTTKAESDVNSPPTVAGGILYVVGTGSAGVLFALDAATGSILWSQSVANGDYSAPAVTGSTVIVSYADELTYAFNALTGAPVWLHSGTGEGGWGQTPVVANGDVYVLGEPFTSDPGIVLSVRTGKRVGTFTASSELPTIYGTTLLVTQGTHESQTVTAENLATGKVLWTQSGDGELDTDPVVADGAVFMGSALGEVYAFSASTGVELWHAKTGAAVVPSAIGLYTVLGGMAVSDGLLAVPTLKGIVVFGTTAK
jgi:outer membrane protein assembly factor BamB